MLSQEHVLCEFCRRRFSVLDARAGLGHSNIFGLKEPEKGRLQQ